MNIPNSIGKIPVSSEEAYLPYPVAVERGIPRLSEAKIHQPNTAAISLINGLMPDQGGLVELNDGLGAYDLVRATLSGKQLTVHASPKNAVDNETDEIVQEGLITLTLPNGLLKVVGVSLPPEATLWLEDRSPCDRAGIFMLGLASRVYEIQDVASDSVVAKLVY